MLLALCHSAEGGWTDVDDISQLSELRASGNNLLWAEADVQTLDERDIALIADEFDLHPLAVEDAVNTRQRPKIDRYENHLFLVVHELSEVEGHLEATQIGCFLGDNYVLTLTRGPRRRSRLPRSDGPRRKRNSTRLISSTPCWTWLSMTTS